MLNKKGVSPYHLCYEVDDIQAVYDDLSSREEWLLMFEPVAFSNRKITYFMNYDVDFIELVNSK